GGTANAFNDQEGTPVNEAYIFVDVQCHPDADGDSVADSADNCLQAWNPDQSDLDGDDAGDACHACSGDDACGDTDDAGGCDGSDLCDGDDSSEDTDSDGTCDDLDGDDDGDGIEDAYDRCPLEFGDFLHAVCDTNEASVPGTGGFWVCELGGTDYWPLQDVF